jgi:SHS2 domain-containing protein
MVGWRHFPHMADIGIHGFGVSLAEAFEQTALAMTAVIADLATVREQAVVAVECSAPDRELLLVDWLNAWVYEMTTRGMLFARFEITLTDGGLRGLGWGEPVDRKRHRPAVQIKGATYTELSVRREADGTWHAQCVVDV